MSWTPSSWRGKPARQLPAYPDSGALAMAESRLALAAAAEFLDRQRSAVPIGT